MTSTKVPAIKEQIKQLRDSLDKLQWSFDEQQAIRGLVRLERHQQELNKEERAMLHILLWRKKNMQTGVHRRIKQEWEA